MHKNFNMWARFLACLLFSHTLNAKILQDEVVISDEKFFSFKEVCLELTKRDSPLISEHSLTELDCMGKIIKVGDFCDKKTMDDPYYIRGLVDKTQKKVICKSAKRVHMKYECKNSYDRFCQEAELGCYLLQELFAKRLKTSHATLLTEGKSKILSCHFLPKNEDLSLPRD
jgi:hypothetical protein